MTTLAITPNWKNKSARFKGTVAAGEHVSVTILNDDGEGGEFIEDVSTLRLRVVNPCNGRTLAIFPEPVPEGETPETWDSDLSPLRCTLNLNTVQMLKAVPPEAKVSLLWVLDDYDNKTLYFKEQFPVEHWPRLRGEEEPTDLDNYKDIIADFDTRLTAAEQTVATAATNAQNAAASASAAAASAATAATAATDAQAGAIASKNAAQTAANDAASAKTAAEDAQDAAEDAQEAAERAQGKAQEYAEAAAESAAAFVVDDTLSVEGAAADAKAVGEANHDLITRIETVQGNLNAETTARETLAAAVGDNRQNLAAEIARAQSAEQSLDNRKADKTAVAAAIQAETSRAQAAEQGLRSDVSSAQTAIADRYTKSEVDAKIAGVQTFSKVVVQTLPDLADADDKTIYLVPRADSEAPDLCDEYVVVAEAGVRRWERIGAKAVDMTLDNAVTRTSSNGVKSSGIWSAIWGALSALPTGFSSLYDWCVAQFAKYLPLTGGRVYSDFGYEMFIGANGTAYAPEDGIWWFDANNRNFPKCGIQCGSLSGDLVFFSEGAAIYAPTTSGTLALAAPNPTAGNLAALDANGNPTDSGISAGDLLTIVTLSDSTETMASILARLNAINAARQHVFFDCSGIDVNPRLYLCTIMIDADANAVRVYDQVTGKLYIGPYDATETIGEVFAKAVDAYHSITVSAVTLDGVTVTGQIVTIREGTDATAPVYATATITDGAPAVFVVPKGMIYFLEITDTLADHFGPRVTSGAKQGIATADAAVTFTYYDAEHIDTSEITTFAKLQEALTWFGTNETAARNNLVGLEIPDTWTATNGTVYDNPRVVWDVHYFEDEDGVSHLGALMGTKYCSSNDVAFDAAEGEECDSATETVAEADVYYYGLALGQTSKTAANLTLLELSTGDALPYADYAKIYKSAIRDTTRNSLQYGYNNWRDSAYRQYLNSDAAAGQWWGATHIGDIAPSQLNSVRGFMAGCSAALLAAAKKVKVATWPNSVTDGPNQITTLYETLDTFFLPSGSEVYGNVNESGGASVEGALSPYWQARTGYTSPNNTATSTRIIYRELPVGSTANRSAASVRLRSATRGTSNCVWYVYASGQVSYNSASIAYASVPACAIY